MDLPANIAKLLGGTCRVMRSPVTGAAPANLADIISLTKVAAVNSGTATAPWLNFGATSDDQSYSRDVSSEGYEINERSGEVLEDITGVERTFSVSLAEITPEHLQLLEGAAAITTIAAGANKSAQKKVLGGAIDEFERQRIAFIGRRKRSQAEVTETDGTKRGAYVAGVLLNAGLTADSSEVSFGPGNLATIPVSFKAYTDDTVGAAIAWFEEQPGLIAAV